MSDRTSRDHEEIVEMLPDYAVGALSDGDLWRVSAHIDHCRECQQDLAHIFETIGVLVEVMPPNPGVKDAVLSRAVRPRESGPASTPDQQLDLHPPITPSPTVSAPGPVVSLAEVRSNAWLKRAMQLGAAAAILALLVGLAAWNIALERRLDERSTIAALLADPSAAHSLTDSELGFSVGGLLYTDPDSNEAFLIAHGLPALDAGQRYQVWLFTETGERVNGGLVTSNPSGAVQALIRAPVAFSNYWAIGLSAEPLAGSAAPTSPLALGGWIR